MEAAKIPLTSPTPTGASTSAAEPSPKTQYSEHSRRLARSHDARSAPISHQIFTQKSTPDSAVDAPQQSQPAPSLFSSVFMRLLPPDSPVSMRLGALLGLNSRPARLQRHTLHMYEACVEQIESAAPLPLFDTDAVSAQRDAQLEQQHQAIIDWMLNDVGLPDTFQTWFSCTMLHVWMIMVRLRPEGPEGKEAIQGLVDHMFRDMEDRLWAMGLPTQATVSRSLKEFLSIFYGGLLALDSTLLASDAHLAGALWRNVFAMKEDNAIASLMSSQPAAVDSVGSRPMTIHTAQLVQYVRRELAHLETLSREQVLTGQITFSSRGMDEL
ncbi:Serine carboxypeptidase 3 [Sorochytrium milnesiophthora]